MELRVCAHLVRACVHVAYVTFHLGRVQLSKALARSSTALVICKSALDRSLILLPRERSRQNNKTATINEHRPISVLV